MPEHINNQDYCQDMVRRGDRDRYILSLFAKADSQRNLLALLAFNQEVAKIRETVSEPMLGEIRLQWWHDVLDEIAQGKVREQPVIQELALALSNKPVHSLLKQSLDARRMDILGEGPADFNALKEYAKGVGGSLHQALSFYYAGSEPSKNCLDAANSLGQAWTMLGLVRAIPFQWQSGKGFLPDNNAAAQLPSPDQAWLLLQPTITEMLQFVQNAKQEALGYKTKLSTNEKPVLLLAKLISIHEKALRKAGNNPFELPLYEKSDFTKLSSLLWTKLTGNYQ